MAHKDVVVHEEEEDFGAAMQKLEIPYEELEQNSIDDEIREIMKDSNSLLEDYREFEEDLSHNVSINVTNDLKPFRTSSNSPTMTRVRSLAPKRPRNKRGRRKRRFFKSTAYLFDSEVDVTDKICLHCGTRNTPLWREGPKGAGTLCNACGMRYRTGRLLPEYRPASSPGFKPNLHSNFHRRVMEIRRKRN
ncbi:hypothetical protein EUTSA_v10002799mg [Eutrema salsugineum]|uniref:GATA-type domain-containing protein n=1 Tax=Eutrema salsugineum TaxID=72664 RepID=V4L5F0_EUTSA|nr:GATA transcription factor 14 [Eutrema salsugineum]XP_024009703.1 GATA transcription factor 14 [Eutrema salsugineum]ESQ37502.1 hypothetical protein EUTSA_v10002799mg [Eutrema salsugineum]